MVELSTLGNRPSLGHHHHTAFAGSAAPEPAGYDCKLALGQHQLCYWFHLGAQLRRQIKGSPGVQPGERLVEAELHAFKLLPEVSRVSGRPASRLPGQPAASSTCATFKLTPTFREQRGGQLGADNSSMGSNLFQLKTNLLEVSRPALRAERLKRRH